MNRRARLHAYIYADYLAHEVASNVKHEYLDGEIYAMAGGTPELESIFSRSIASWWWTSFIAAFSNPRVRPLQF